MTDNLQKTLRTILYFGMVVMAYLLLRDVVTKPSAPVTVTRDTTKQVQIIIQGDSWKPTTIVPSSNQPYIPLNYDSLAASFVKLYAEHNSTNSYDTTLSDSVSINAFSYPSTKTDLKNSPEISR